MGSNHLIAGSKPAAFPLRQVAVREDVALYPQTPWSTLERTLMTGCPVNAFWPQARIDNAARQVYRGERPLAETLAELR